MATATLTWTEMKGEAIHHWTRSDGRASVQVRLVECPDRRRVGWTVEMYEATGRDLLCNPCSYIGSEPPSPSRAGAMTVARRWVRKLTRPTTD